MRTIHVLITDKKVHLYGSWTRVTKVRQRAERMGVKLEATCNTVRTGDPFKSVAVDTSEMTLPSFCCVAGEAA